MHRLGLQLVLLLMISMVLGALSIGDEAGRAYLLRIDGTIGPATSDYVHRSIERAVEEDARLIILQMDTPGGLDASMRSIVKDILASGVPVAGYVAPSGARAASAGTYILYAAHVAVMAPGTNLGAATPVALGGLPGIADKQKDPPEDGGQGAPSKKSIPKDAMKAKLVNDAAAYIRGLARLRGRNMEWAESAVREAVSLPAQEALELKVIDSIAPNIQTLLSEVDGHTVQLPSGARVLDTERLQVLELAPDWRNRLLSVISNPSVAYILMLVGVYGLVYEFANPGAILPGTVGAVSLLVALYAFQVLPVNYAGMALMLLGLALMAAEAFMPSFGVLGVGGLVAWVWLNATKRTRAEMLAQGCMGAIPEPLPTSLPAGGAG